MKLWKLNKRSSTLADMSMNRILLSELIVKGALVGIHCRIFWRCLSIFNPSSLSISGGI